MANINEIIYFSFKLSSCVWLHIKIMRVKEAQEEPLFAGFAVFVGTAL